VDLIAGLLEAIAPTRCAGCDLPGGLLCEACRDSLPRIEMAHACPRCGAPFGWIVCTECWETEFSFSEARCVGTLERPLSRCVTLYKDGGERRLAPVMGALLAEALESWRGWPDAVVPIPASSEALRRRGFDHVFLLAEEIAASLGVGLERPLVRIGACRDQRRLGREARRLNVRGVLEVRPDTAIPERVLLVDDVFTTGSTLDEAAAAMMLAGSREVRVCSVARAW